MLITDTLASGLAAALDPRAVNVNAAQHTPVAYTAALHSHSQLPPPSNTLLGTDVHVSGGAAVNVNGGAAPIHSTPAPLAYLSLERAQLHLAGAVGVANLLRAPLSRLAQLFLGA